MPEKNNAAVVSISGTTCIRERGGDVGDSIAARGNTAASG